MPKPSNPLVLKLLQIQAALQAATDQVAMFAEPEKADEFDHLTKVVDDGYTALALLSEMLAATPEGSINSGVAQAYVNRRKAHEGQRGWKQGTATDQARQLEFFIGAWAAAEAFGHPQPEMTLALLAIGRDCSELIPKEPNHGTEEKHPHQAG